MEDFISADPCQFDHAELFRIMQNLTLDYRLNDPYASLGWYSPGQLFVLDEYCARYGVRGCYRHLCYLADLLDRAEKHIMIDPTLIHYSFAFCASHVHGNRPDGVGSITHEEMERFQNIKERLRVLLEYQITNFRYFFLPLFTALSDHCQFYGNIFFLVCVDTVFHLDDRKVH